MKKLIRELIEGDKQAAAKLISIIENDRDVARGIIQEIKPFTGRAHIVGVTGAPGCGKSTLINGLTGLLRKRNKKVGVIAVDPTSPLTGGALLGDRIRMADHFGDRGVFIRSMATRDGKGGLSRAAVHAASILDALGMEVIFMETTGVGQSETAVKGVAHTVVVVVTPNMGDDVQMMKAGLMEIGDIFVVNKGDLGNAEEAAHELEGMMRMLPRGGKQPPVIITAATEGKGIKKLLEVVERHRRGK